MKISEKLLPLSLEEVYTNSRAKINPRTGEVMEVCTANRLIFKARKDVDARPLHDRKKLSVISPEVQEVWDVEEASTAWQERKEKADGEAARRAASRAKRRLFDLAACNDFDMFFTLTLQKEHIDRYDYKAAVKEFGQWLDNRVRRRGLRYVAVPELHKDGAIHFHGLCNSEALRLVDSGHKDKAGRTVYNVTDWSARVTTAVYVDGNYTAVCRYVSKYITKQQSGGTIGGRYFYHGGELEEPVYRYFNSAAPAAAKAVEIPDGGLTLYYWPNVCSIEKEGDCEAGSMPDRLDSAAPTGAGNEDALQELSWQAESGACGGGGRKPPSALAARHSACNGNLL